MASPAQPSIPFGNDVAAAYQAAYDNLDKAYWEASDIDSKDFIHGTMSALSEIISDTDEQDLAANTALFEALEPKIKAANQALNKIKEEIAKITKNIATAGMVVAAINKAVSMFPGLV